MSKKTKKRKRSFDEITGDLQTLDILYHKTLHSMTQSDYEKRKEILLNELKGLSGNNEEITD